MTLEVKVTSGTNIPWGKKIQVRFYEIGRASCRERV